MAHYRSQRKKKPMAVKDETGTDLVVLMLKPNWKGQTGLHISLAPLLGSVTMGVAHVDELIGELIQMRDMMDKLNQKPE